MMKPFDQLYVVHYTRLKERKTYLEPILKRLGWSANWIETMDPQKILPDVWKRINNPRLTKAEISVYMKHLEIFRDIIDSNHHLNFVIEDDVIFPQNFPNIFPNYIKAIPQDFDMVFFGSSCDYEVPPDLNNQYFGQARGTRSMSGYMITPTCLKSSSPNLISDQ